MRADLFEKMEHLPATQVRWRCPFLRPRVPEEDLSEEIKVYAISAEAMPRLVLVKLYGQICIPDIFP